MNHPLRMSKLTLGLMAVLAAAPAFAQSTSAGVGGQVVSSAGAPVAGAEVTITHTESGTVSRATTDAAGRYNARGLRVGGPYTISITKPGEGTKTEDGVYLGVNQTGTINATLAGDLAATNLDAVQVMAVGGGSEVFSTTKMGSSTNISQEQIEMAPSIGGNIQDLMRLDPRVTFIDRASGSISAGGQNPRFNSINIDGVSASDTFGLEGNNMPTRRQPVAMEAIEALDINLSNYDVSIAAAAGATVNAVTKSGTNEVHGSVYGTYRDGDWFGDNPEGQPFKGFTKEETYGVTVGGPIVKDKLFFFANYEKFKQAAPGADLSGTALGKAGANYSMADVTRAQQIAQDVYGFDAGGIESNADTELEEYAIKLDWNINDNHRANFRYSKLEQDKLRINGMNSTSTASLSSYWYQHVKTNESYVAQLFSDWSDNFSTELKASYREYSAVREVSTNAPSIRIYFPRNLTTPEGDSLYLGTEVNSQDNILETKAWNYYAAGTLTMGDHDLKFGASYDTNDIYNYYGANSWGTYTFYGLDNFAAGRWQTYNLAKETAPGSIAADYEYSNLALFVQDTWYVNNNLTLTMGVRADRPDTSPSPQFNQAALNTFGLDNSKVFESKFLIQPRLGFNYTFDSERPTQLRGGVGLFQGDSPQVWISNSYSTTGFNYTSYNLTGGFNPALPFSADKNNQPVPTTPGSARQNVNFVGQDFKLPSIYKANLALDHELPWNGLVASAELLVTKVKDGLYYQHLNLGSGNLVGPDGRTLYYNPARVGLPWNTGSARFGTAAGFDNVYLIDNTDQGRTSQFTVSLSKPWAPDSDWSYSLAYTYTDAEEVGSLTSSTASSGWGYQYATNANEELLNTSRYQIRDRFSGSLNWKHKFFGDYETKVGLVYEGRSGRPFSYIYANDANGDGRNGNDLFYVPNRGDVLFGALNANGTFTPDAAMEKSFFDWLAANPDLAKYAGGSAPANKFRSGWINTFDIRISQQLPGFMKGHKSEIWLDVQNVGNLLNKDWGNIYDYGFFANSRVATLQGIYNDKYVYNYTGADKPSVANQDADGFDAGVSQWSLQLGFRYQF
ncbi:TonB-dependent receptor [Stenotrophomonas sp. CFBP 13718]|uniref:TonB-dependent receptor n=1 Tax=Stenotrophomonas sp. CFBP 13718 TaxID=2775304 RepID=UPI002017A78A|nr:TonB-dependent receptor [Stenotrophomonas sp. CFBP 13718]